MPPKRIQSSTQYQNITQALKGITDFYPAESCLRELLQNADDARASEIEYVLDTTAYQCDPRFLIDPCLEAFQGPALLARNDAIFTKNDIESLRSVGVSGKRQDILVAGKFGRGFNSVYHWTDGPSIYSQNRLLFQDPHNHWDGGGVFPTIEAPQDLGDPDCLAAKEHLKAFSRFSFDSNVAYPGTIIRIPLRTREQSANSEICGKETTVKEIKEFLLKFAQEIGETGLLFLKHITKVILRLDEEILSVTQVQNLQEVQLGRQKILEHLESRKDLSKCFEMEIRHFISKTTGTETNQCDVPSSNQRYLLQHIFRQGPGDRALDGWAREGKLIPWVAIAVQIDPLVFSPCYPKPLSSTLCLPKKIKQPVFLHGLWAIAPDRQRLSTETSGEAWNAYMFSKLVASAWIHLLLQRSSSSPTKEGFNFWPTPVENVQDPWDHLYDIVVKSAIEKNLPIWNTGFNCVNSKKAFFADEKLSGNNLAKALAQIKMPVVYLSTDLYVSVEKSPVTLQTLNPSTVLAYVHANIEKLSLASADMKIRLFEYCLRAKDFPQLAEVPIWPLLNEHFTDAKSSLRLLPRSEDELALFRSSRPNITIDVAMLSLQASKSLNQFHVKLFKETSIRYRDIPDLAEDLTTLYPATPSSDLQIARPPLLDGHLRKLWAWICDRAITFQGTQLKEAFKKLEDSSLFFPTTGNRIRHFASTQDIPTLIVVEKDLRRLLVRMAEECDVRACILDEEILQTTGLGLAEKIGSQLPATQIETSTNLLGLVRWLAAAGNLIPSLPDEDRVLLMKFICRVIEKRYDPLLKSMIAKCLRQLPIFQMVVSAATTVASPSLLDRAWTDLIEGRKFVSMGNLPAVPVHDKITFIKMSTSGEKQLARTFDLIEDPPVELLISDHVIPSIAAKSLNKVSERLLIQYVLERSVNLSNDWRRQNLTTARIFPSRSQSSDGDLKCPSDLYDPDCRNLEGLFFDDETVFPDPVIFEEHHVLLKQCGLHAEINADVIRSRVRHFNKAHLNVSELSGKVSKLLLTPLTHHELSDSSLKEELQSLKWIPSTFSSRKEKMSPKECRPSDVGILVSQTFALVDFEVSSSWRQLLGWHKPIDLQTLLDQISKYIENNNTLDVQKVLDYIETKYAAEDYVPKLQNLRCLPGSQGLYLPCNIFSLKDKDLSRMASRLAPYMDTLPSNIPLSPIHINLGIQNTLSIDNILAIQKRLLESGPVLNPQDLEVAVTILQLARSFSREDLTDLMGPDKDSRLVKLAELTISPESGIFSSQQLQSLRFVHQSVPLDTLLKIQVDTVRGRKMKVALNIEEEDDDEYTPMEDIITRFSDCLHRYTPANTFNEYLSNAEDCRATTLEFVIDECPPSTYPSTHLLTEEMSCLQGPSLFVYNDQVFSEKDFEGFKQIGRGSKAGDEHSIGMFGMGAVTMYHFTDTPMIISGSTLLILDPQQTLLPRKSSSNKRKVGIKVSLAKAQLLFPDQLKPFEGLFEYDSTTVDFDGTIFRFPLRDGSTNSALVDSSSHLSIESVRNLLEDYFETAVRAPIFLRNVRTIGFRRRSEVGHQWRVVSQHPTVAHGLLQKMVITKFILKEGSEQSDSGKDEWLFAVYDYSPPPTIGTPPKLRSKKVQCGVAALSSNNTRAKHFIYSTLPTPFPSSLPISFHGTFAMTGDRQTIPHGDLARANESIWNEWLLKQCIPRLYISFLADVAAEKPDLVYQIWPSVAKDSTSQMVKDAFWAALHDEENRNCNLFPLTEQSITRGSRIATLVTAYFDLLPATHSPKLQVFLLKLFPKLVRLPTYLHAPFQQSIKNANADVHILNDGFLCETFEQEDPCMMLEAHLFQRLEGGISIRKDFWIHLMNVLIPPSGMKGFAEVLTTGCRILPLRDGKFGKIMPKVISPATQTFVRGSDEETMLFDFAGDFFIDSHYDGSVGHSYGSQELLNPLAEFVSSGLFNVREMLFSDIGILLRHVNSPIAPSSETLAKWLPKFWRYFNIKLRGQLRESSTASPDEIVGETALGYDRVFQEHELQDMLIYRTVSATMPKFLSPKMFKEGAYMIQPSNTSDADLCTKVPGLIMVDREQVPYPLREEEGDLSSPASFQRFVKCLLKIPAAKIQGLDKFLNSCLSGPQLDRLRFVISSFVLDNDSSSVFAELHSLPVWPLIQPKNGRDNVSYIALTSAVVSIDAEMIHPWVQNLDTWIDPTCCVDFTSTLRKLGRPPLPVREVWDKVAPDIPRNGKLRPDQLGQYKQLLTRLSREGIKTSLAIAPDGKGNLCLPESLYDESETLFSAAFRHDEDTRFLHKDVRQLKDFWKSTGLRHRFLNGAVREQDYIQCVRALDARCPLSSQTIDQHYQLDAINVTLYIRWQQQHFMDWRPDTWSVILASAIFEVRLPTDQLSYRQARMQELARKQPFLAPAKAGLGEHIDISWSQMPFLSNEPCARAYIYHINKGAPSVDVVVEHLKFMMEIRLSVQDNELPLFLADIQKSYDFLQNSGQLESQHEASEAAIWLNLETTDVTRIQKSDLESALTTLDKLCFDCPVDPLPMKRVRTFLVPYERLLRGLGCETVDSPPVPVSEETEADKLTPDEAMMRAISQHRAGAKLFDVIIKFKNDDKELKAHRLILSAASSYFETAFSPNWSKPDYTMEDVTYDIFKLILDYLYTGILPLASVSVQDDKDSVADALDHCLDLLHAADFLVIPRLRKMMESFILTNHRVFIRADNVRMLTGLAEKFKARTLHQYCLDYELKNKKTIDQIERLGQDGEIS